MRSFYRICNASHNVNPIDSSKGNENGTYEAWAYGVPIAGILSEERLERNCPEIKFFLESPDEAV